jgi:integrase
MAHIRRLLTPEQKRRQRAGELPEGEKPKGLWQATVRHPSGERFSKSDPLKKVVQTWADDEEAKIRRGEWINPHAGEITLAKWWAKWLTTRRVETATMARDTSQWRNHIEPKFGTWPLAAINSWDIETWVSDMTGKVGAVTVQDSLRLLSQLLGEKTGAVRHKLLTANPAAAVIAPTPPSHVDRILSRAEAETLLEQFTGKDRLFVELLLYTGLRWSEAANLKGFRVDLLRKRLQVKKVRDRKGKEKEPKTPSGVRLVPLTDELVVALSRIVTPDDSLVFTAPQGGRLVYQNWMAFVWWPALAKAGLVDPQPTPHDLRHTYGSWLGEAGVPPKQIAALMGHKTLRSVERYIHETEARFEQARAALGAAVERREETPERNSGMPE